MIDRLMYTFGRISCALFGIETTACRGRKACWEKHHGGQP